MLLKGGEGAFGPCEGGGFGGGVPIGSVGLLFHQGHQDPQIRTTLLQQRPDRRRSRDLGVFFDDLEAIFQLSSDIANRLQVQHRCPSFDGVGGPKQFLKQLPIRQGSIEGGEALL